VSALLLVSCVVLFVVPLFFVAHSVYKDGVIGRASLLAISFTSAGILMEAALGTAFYVPSIFVILITAFAVFTVWHLARFHIRVLKKQSWSNEAKLER
jgi:hypothetical protein